MVCSPGQERPAVIPILKKTARTPEQTAVLKDALVNVAHVHQAISICVLSTIQWNVE